MSLRALFIDGVHSHDTWPETGRVVRAHLAQADIFELSHVRAPDPEQFRADFSGFDVIIPYYCPVPRAGRDPAWPGDTRTALDRYVREGGGLVIIHAASNAFASWPEYNRMIGLGGWGGRDATAGAYLYLEPSGRVVRSSEPGPAGHHEPEFEYTIDVRAPGHPVMAGMPARWLHCQDEVYGNLRGPGVGVEVLASAFSGKTQDGTQRHEPVVMTISYGAGRVFHTTLGHSVRALECGGVRALLQRGTEWAATGRVTLPLPDAFPTEHATARSPV